MREEMSNVRPFVLASVNNDGESGGRSAVRVRRRRVFEPVILFAFSSTKKKDFKKGLFEKLHNNTAKKSGIIEK